MSRVIRERWDKKVWLFQVTLSLVPGFDIKSTKWDYLAPPFWRPQVGAGHLALSCFSACCFR